MGSCVSSFSKKQTKLDAGISSATAFSQTTNKKAGNRFHENDNVANSPSTNVNNARKAKVVKRQKKKIHKGLIGLPSNFQHTGHIGITELRSGKVDPEKIKNQMAEVAAALSLEDLNLGSSVPPTIPINNDINSILSASSEQQQIVSENNNDNNSNKSTSPQNDYQFKVKRKPTLTPISSPVQQRQNSRSSSPSSLNPMVDPMAEIVAALKMPIHDQLVV